MAGIYQFIRKLVARWSREQEIALWQMTKRKTARARLAGFAKSERVEAKFLLLAFAPAAPIIISDGLGWPRGIVWHAWACLSAAWALAIVGLSLAAHWRALRRALRRDA